MICVADTGNERVRLCNWWRSLLGLTEEGVAVPTRSDFTGIAIGGSGTIYLADPEASRVVQLRATQTQE